MTSRFELPLAGAAWVVAADCSGVVCGSDIMDAFYEGRELALVHDRDVTSAWRYA